MAPWYPSGWVVRCLRFALPWAVLKCFWKLALWCCFKPVVSVIKVDAGFVDNGVRGINHLLIGEGSVADLGIGLDVFDVAV